MQLQMWPSVLSVLAAGEGEVAQVRLCAVAALVALRVQASVNADNASLPRIDAVLAAFETLPATSDAYWQRGVDALLATDLRPGEVAMLLRALKSTRR